MASAIHREHETTKTLSAEETLSPHIPSGQHDFVQQNNDYAQSIPYGGTIDQTTTVAQSRVVTTDQAIICVICLELVQEEATALPCRHNHFHFPCLGTWLQQRRSCPLCKVEVLSIQYQDEKLQGPSVFHLPSLTTSRSSHNPQHHRGRLHARYGVNHRHRIPTSIEDISENDSLHSRRRVYEEQRYSLYVGNNRISRYRNMTPAVFRADPTMVNRAKKWIRRELRALDPFHQYATATATGADRSTDLRNNEFLLEYILAILRHIDLKGSAGQAELLLREQVGSRNARLFLHELENWLRSPFDSLEDWDAYVQYADAEHD